MPDSPLASPGRRQREARPPGALTAGPWPLEELRARTRRGGRERRRRSVACAGADRRGARTLTGSARRVFRAEEFRPASGRSPSTPPRRRRVAVLGGCGNEKQDAGPPSRYPQSVAAVLARIRLAGASLAEPRSRPGGRVDNAADMLQDRPGRRGRPLRRRWAGRPCWTPTSTPCGIRTSRLLEKSGATLKEAMPLARHSGPRS